jgi:hypothetical protein
MSKLNIPEGTGPTPELLWRQCLALAEAAGISREYALTAVIHEHLIMGDLEPFLASQAELNNLSRPQLCFLLNSIALMLTQAPGLDYHLELTKPRPGQPPKPGTFTRNVLMWLKYTEYSKAMSSEKAFAAVGSDFGIGADTVRKAISNIRELAKSPLTN